MKGIESISKKNLENLNINLRKLLLKGFNFKPYIIKDIENEYFNDYNDNSINDNQFEIKNKNEFILHNNGLKKEEIKCCYYYCQEPNINYKEKIVIFQSCDHIYHDLCLQKNEELLKKEKNNLFNLIFEDVDFDANESNKDVESNEKKMIELICNETLCPICNKEYNY